MVVWLTRYYPTPWVRGLGECCLCTSNSGTAETETFCCFYFDCPDCRCFCIYVFVVFGQVPPTLRLLHCRALLFLLFALSNPFRPIRSILADLPNVFGQYLTSTLGTNTLLVDLPAYDSRVQNTFLNNSLRCSNYLANRCQLSKIIHYTHANILICVRFAIVKTQGNIF